MYGSFQFWSLVCLELTLSLKVFCDAEQYCVLLACVDCLQCVSSSAFKGCCSLSSLLRTSQWPEQSGFCFWCFWMMFSFLEHLSIASEVLAVKFYIAIFWCAFISIYTYIISIHLHLYLYLYLYLYMYMYISISIYVYKFIYTYIYISLSLSIYIYIYLSLSIYISVYLYIYICIYLSLSFSLSIYLSI